MVLLCVILLVICLSVATEKVIYKKSGDDLTLTCSSVGCLSGTDGSVGMYLYQDFITQEEVLYSSNSKSPVSVRQRYQGRIQTSGSFKNRSITISNLTVDDSGIYTCVYKKTPKSSSKCDGYIVVIKGNASCSLATHVQKRSPPLVLVVVSTCLISTLTTTLLLMLVFLKGKHWKRSRTLRRASQLSNVYEVMTKKGSQQVEHPQQPSEGPIDLV